MNREKQAKIKGPLATQRNVNNVNLRTNIILVIEIIIIILSILLMWPWANINNTTNNIELNICPASTSILCDDFNPCTLDLIIPICGNITNNGGGTSCQSFQCQNIPLANGSCCSAGDVCYYDDPNKACVFGTCKSPDPTLCKGYCVGDDASTCPPLPFNINTNITIPTVTCLFNSCVTMFQFVSPIADATSILDTSVAAGITNLNIEACLESTCAINLDFGNPFPFINSVCIFKWKCAPYIDLLLFEKKRGLLNYEEEKESNNKFKFPIHGGVTDYQFYNKINNKINKIIDNMGTSNHKYHNLYNNNNNNNSSNITRNFDFKLNTIYKLPTKSGYIN